MANKVRLIDYDAAIDRYYAEYEKQDICCGDQDRDWLKKCFDEAPTIDPETLRPKGRWVVNRKSFDGYTHHRCSHCGTDAPFVYTYIDEWDEDLGGEWDYIGQRENGIEEQMGSFCPNCGADMRGDSE